MSNLAAALEYAARGWHVIPLHSWSGKACSCGKAECRSPAKHPRIENGLLNASADPQQVREWWGRWPSANIGVRTGEVSGFWAFDIDHGKGGEESLAALIAEHGALPVTVLANTGGGGLHYLFRYSGAVKNRGGVFTGVDVRGDGGYIVVAPSNHASGGVYAWAEGCAPGEIDLAEAPAWLLSAVSAPSRTRDVGDKAHSAPSFFDGDEVAKVRSALPFVRGVDDRDTWVEIGMALHSGFDGSETGFGLWCEWSQQSAKFHMADSRKVWSSFKGGGLGLGTLFEYAKQSGWKPPRPEKRQSAPTRTRAVGGEAPSGDLTEPLIPLGSAGAYDTDWQDRLARNKDGGLRADIFNTRLVIEFDPAWRDVLGYDEFSYRVMKRRAPPFDGGCVGEWSDSDTARLRIWLAESYGFTPKAADADDAVLVVAELNKYHPVREYLNGLVWDGGKRLGSWLIAYLGVEDTPYSRAVSVKWLVAAVARVMRPPVKADCVLILEGSQGLGKSSALGILGGDWFDDTGFALGDKDGYQQIQGRWIIEMAELDSLNKAESTKAKSFFSSQTDRYRPSYGRRTMEFNRQCVFAGSTNQSEYLKDVTGNRRYWPVKCTQIMHKELKRDRDQLFAEAVAAFKAGIPWWVRKDELQLFESEQDSRFDADVWEGVILEWLADNPQLLRVSAADIMSGALKMDPAHMKRPEQTRVGMVMGRLEWHKRRGAPVKIGEKEHRPWVYVRPGFV